jgi:hypothetical protein
MAYFRNIKEQNMTTSKRKMEKIDNNDNTWHYGCEACTWPGIELPAESDEEAKEAFAVHHCWD